MNELVFILIFACNLVRHGFELVLAHDIGLDWSMIFWFGLVQSIGHVTDGFAFGTN
jgi:hypothetical protein